MLAKERAIARREARRIRTTGIVFTAIGGSFVPLGALAFVAGRTHTDGGGWSAYGTLIGTGMLGIGGFALLMGFPMLVFGSKQVQATRATAMPAIQIGPTSGALTWTF